MAMVMNDNNVVQATRLLGIGPEKIILLDCRTKVLTRSQPTADLIQVGIFFIITILGKTANLALKRGEKKYLLK